MTRSASSPSAVLLAALVGLVLVVGLWSLTIGSTPIPIRRVLNAIMSQGDMRDEIVIWTIRLPRLAAAVLVGAGLGVSGAIMQAVTNNPLASPDLLGISAGAAFAVVLSIVLFNSSSPIVFLWVAFAGAAVAGALVFAIGSIGYGGATPIKLALAGAVISIFLGSLSTSLLMFDLRAIDTIRMWSIGSLAGKQGQDIATVAPFLLAGVAGALIVSRELSTISLGGELAKSVGQDVTLWRLIFGILVMLTAGSSVAIAGPIGFVGLVTPHVVRLAIGSDVRWLLPFCAIGGALLVLLADALQRRLTGIDVPVGVTLALIGAPFFIWLARSRINGIA